MIKKATLPVAGLGTRFLPASKSIPKEMVTGVDRLAIEYVIKEAVEAGIEQIMVESVSDDVVDQYRIVDVKASPAEGESIVMQGIVEKPAVGSAPSNLSVVRRYVLRKPVHLC
ncbi:hypothetical protein JHL22_10985 [Advenella sp. WQ 585]|uniref:UTP--glucose-1-phosphate uridylyltransferase n=1 Tax=Advenella mandrilli TaxID=2800330 RepID=A0ABS1ECS2_9BURK|nr:hypothetical protein [Advenella mandrilli]MBK1781742.1 hypothetical protein [Advenella mandrilli]